MNVPNLRSPYVKTAGIFYFGRMIDKIRLHAQGHLPVDYQPNLGSGFDARCLKFLRVRYEDLAALATRGETDEAIIQWCFEHGRKPDEEEIEVWNEFMRKRGWNDVGTPTLERRLKELGYTGNDIQTMFDYIDADEGRHGQASAS